MLAARIVIALLPFAAIRQLLVQAHDAGSPAGAAAARRISAVVAATAHRPLPWASCLTQALAAHWMLARRGIGTRIRFGVKRGPQGLHSHAWLVHGGEHLLGGPAVGFSPVAEYPARMRKGDGIVSDLGNLAPRR